MLLNLFSIFLLRDFMTARIYQKSKTAMQSGVKNSGHWILEFEQNDAKPIDPFMKWVGSDDMSSQVSINFSSKENAIDYATKNNIVFILDDGKAKKYNIRKGGYGENFDYNRKKPWTH